MAVAVLAAMLGAAPAARAQQAPTPERMETLRKEQRWGEIARALDAVRPRTAEMDFTYGLALAHLGRWSEATAALEDGRRLAPREARFDVELAGIAYRQKQNARAERLLRRALRLDPGDAYANDFLATLDYLDGNLEAALQDWNRVGKPRIAALRNDPEPEVSAALLDHAFAFGPESTLLLPQFLATERRLRGLGIFPAYQIDLAARKDGRFDAVLRARELNGLGGGGWTDALLLLRGIAFQEVNPGYWNLKRQAINFDSMLRWDAQKRRIYLAASGPLLHGARYRWESTTDLRDETWAIVPSFTGPAPLLAAFNMRTERADLGVVSYASARVGWSAAAEVSHRDFRNVNAGSVLTPQMLAPGFELKQRARMEASVWRVPEHRFTVDAGAEEQVARLWSPTPESFAKFAGSLRWQWLPQRKGDNYAMAQQVRAGRIAGAAPFDELYILGLERDNNLPMHAHIGTRDGRKGSAPLGREYFLQNWQLNRNLYSNGLMQVQLGPLLDMGRIADPGGGLGSHQWLFDTGAQLKLRVLGSGLAFSYGRDLRTGNNAFYVMLLE